MRPSGQSASPPPPQVGQMLSFALRAAGCFTLFPGPARCRTGFAPSASLKIRPPEIGIVDFRYRFGRTKSA